MTVLKEHDSVDHHGRHRGRRTVPLENAELWRRSFRVSPTSIGVTSRWWVWGAMQIGIGILATSRTRSGESSLVPREPEVVAGILVGVITIGLLPALVSMTVGFATSAAARSRAVPRSPRSGCRRRPSDVASAAAQVAAQYRTVAGWVASSAAAVANGAIMVGQWIRSRCNGNRAGGYRCRAWVASSARTVGALALQGAAFIAHRAVMIAGAVATERRRPRSGRQPRTVGQPDHPHHHRVTALVADDLVLHPDRDRAEDHHGRWMRS
ncbi:hypothetical protein GS432_18720 [Rhodococcus hoagii]|nr:hypothetical protein [Prescottella equi]